MDGLGILAALSMAQSSKPATLELTDKGFRIVAASGKGNVPLPVSAPAPKLDATRIQFRKDDAFVVWDSRGLTVRHGSAVSTTRFERLPTDPAHFSRDQIADHRLAIRFGERSAGANRVIASKRFGNTAYFALDWVDRNGHSWLQAIVRVPLDTDKPKAELIAKVDGTLEPIGKDVLPVLQGRLFWVEQNDRTWGIAAYDIAKGALSRKDMGKRLIEARLHSGRIGHFLEEATDGRSLLGRFDLLSRSRRDLVESTGYVTLLDHSSPWIAMVRDETGVSLQNLETSARLKVDLDQRVSRNGKWVVVSNGAPKVLSAVAYDAERWTPIARWTAPKPAQAKPKPKPAAPTKPSGTRPKPPARPSSRQAP